MRIFIIDDEQVSILIIQQKLLLLGVLTDGKELCAFLSAKEALADLTQRSEADLPEIIFLDLNMPEMDGWHFLDALAPLKDKLKEECRIYVLTSSLALSDEARAKDNPLIAGFFHKPLNNENIRTIFSLNPHVA